MKTRFLKSVNDFVIGTVLLGFGIFIARYKDIVKGTIAESAGGYLVRPDVYVRLIGVLLIICSLILVIKSINFRFRRPAETRGFHFVITKEVVISCLALLLYAVMLEPAGFNITTFLLTLLLTYMYMRKEETGEGKPPFTWRVRIRTLIIAAVYSVALVIAVYLIFAKALNVILPDGALF